MQRNPVGWFEIYVQDMARARKFYESVLDVDLSPLNAPDAPDGPSIEMMAFPMEMELPGAAGALTKMEGFPSGQNSVLIYFSCDDCEVEAGRVASAGGRVQQEKMSIGEYGFIALAHDTEGNMFGLHSTK
jgi:hypothetical protein